MQQQDNDPLEEIDLELDDRPPQKPRRDIPRHSDGSKKRLIWIAVIAAAALALLGGAAYWWLAVRGEEEQPAAAQNEQQQSAQPVRENPDLSPQEAAEIVTYKNDALKLELKHRRDWIVKESDDKTGITLMSPPIGYETQNGNVPEAQGVFTLHIRTGSVSEAGQETINGTAAVRDSKIIAYAEPTEAQRYYTNVSYAGQDGFLKFFIVTGSAEYKTEDILANTLPLSSADYFLIAGGYGEDPDGTLEFDLVPADQIDSEVFKQAIAIVESLKLY